MLARLSVTPAHTATSGRSLLPCSPRCRRPRWRDGWRSVGSGTAKCLWLSWTSGLLGRSAWGARIPEAELATAVRAGRRVGLPRPERGYGCCTGRRCRSGTSGSGRGQSGRSTTQTRSGSTSGWAMLASDAIATGTIYVCRIDSHADRCTSTPEQGDLPLIWLCFGLVEGFETDSAHR